MHQKYNVIFAFCDSDDIDMELWTNDTFWLWHIYFHHGSVFIGIESPVAYVTVAIGLMALKLWNIGPKVVDKWPWSCGQLALKLWTIGPKVVDNWLLKLWTIGLEVVDNWS